jgi:hypothetical protein
MYFQQDGAPPHKFLDNMFGGTVISTHGSTDMPPSPDRTPMDFYFWGVVKGKAYIAKPKILDNLNSVIEDTSAKTDNNLQLYKTVCSSVPECFQQHINSEGSQFQHLT